MKVFEWEGWRFEPREWRLTSPQAGIVSLPNKSLALLGLLLERAPRLVAKDQILSAVWPDSVVEEGNIAFHIALLRKTLDLPGGETSCIETVRGRGYRFVARVDVLETSSSAIWTSDIPAASSVAADPEAVTPLVPVSAQLAPKLEIAPPLAAALAETAPGPPSADLPSAADSWRRHVSHGWPVVIVALAAVVMGWLALSADAAVREVVVLPPQIQGDVPPGLPGLMAERIAAKTSARTRVAALAHPSETAIEAGRRLQAETVLVTSANQSSGRWRIHVQLARTRDAHVLWSWVFEVDAQTPEIQTVIASRISDGLGRHLGSAAGVPAPDRSNAEAVMLTLRGREAWGQRTPPSVQQAITFFERAIALDPAYAPAYAGLADCYNLTMSGLPLEVRAVNAKANAARALELDPDLAEAHTSLAFSLYKFDWRWQESEAEFRRAIALDPSYALAHHWYGEMLAYLGRFDEAIAEMSRARALEPNSLPILMDLVGPMLHSGRVAEARAVVEAAAAINPMFHAVPGRMSEILAAEGRERESMEQAWQALVLRGASLESVEELRAAYRTGGRPAALRIEIARLEKAGMERFVVQAHATFLASKYAQLGDRANTLKWIATAIDRREDIALHLPTYPEYHWLRDDPEFKRQIARLGLSSIPRK